MTDNLPTMPMDEPAEIFTDISWHDYYGFAGFTLEQLSEMESHALEALVQVYGVMNRLSAKKEELRNSPITEDLDIE